MSAIPYDAPEEDWVDYQDDDTAQLPGRPRRRWWGRGTALLLALLLGAIGFYVGVRVEKGQLASSTSTGSSSGLAALASRFGRGTAASGASGAASASSAGGTSRFGAGGAASLFGGGSGGGASFGTVSSVNGNTIYVQTSTGNVIKVTLSSATKVTKSQGVSKKALRPGDTVVVAGVKGSNGAISATSVSDSGSRSTSTGSSSSSSSSSGSSAVSSLFGSGGG